VAPLKPVRKDFVWTIAKNYGYYYLLSYMHSDYQELTIELKWQA